ncbi:hypothetical protein NPIL_446521 [Nephila pilipes]|uniref:Uncharacterized protein n=1 Tax=Nephila pilipes TaxID=299642 RepID=A0A8X6U4M8_NEPPI|nr:hypothetical protein NPIL_299951 [Nephila pilipes]GFT77941.1 hypothetical protein NPIL_446521 [Nephila pilipes]
MEKDVRDRSVNMITSWSVNVSSRDSVKKEVRQNRYPYDVSAEMEFEGKKHMKYLDNAKTFQDIDEVLSPLDCVHTSVSGKWSIVG